MTQVPTTEEAMRLLEDAEIRLRQRDYMRHQYGVLLRAGGEVSIEIIERGIEDLARTCRENACGDEDCERTRLAAALLVLHGGKEHLEYARLVMARNADTHSA